MANSHFSLVGVTARRFSGTDVALFAFWNDYIRLALTEEELTKKNVCVLFGGRSVEHEISLISGLQLIEALDQEQYAAIPVYVAQSGAWYTGPELLDKSFYKQLPSCLEQLAEVTLIPKPHSSGLHILRPAKTKGLGGLFGKSASSIPVDVYIPAFHGTFGEDGCMQGLFELADVPYVGSNVLASAVAMNKSICKNVAAANGVPVLPSYLATKAEFRQSVAETRQAIRKTPGLEHYPLFIKPVHLGSSVGIGKAASDQELDAALLEVFKYDSTAIVEPCVTDIMEVNISVLDAENLIASVTEIPVGTDGVLSYEDKYMRDGGGKKGKLRQSEGMASLSRVIDPEDLDPDIKNAIEQHALTLARVIEASGVSRFDFIVDTSSNQIYFNEVNPIPGSFAFYLWEKSKPPLLYTQMLQKMIERALERKEAQADFSTDTGFKALFA